jgi:hypothetical protein
MHKKILLFIVLLILVAAGGYIWRKTTRAPMPKEDAIRQAERYRPTGVCAQALTPAVHPATGAEFTFSSTCMPDGWEPKPR